MADRQVAIKSKVVPGKDLGNPKAVTMLPEGQNRMTMGILMGRATNIISRTMPTGEIYEGLSGSFEATPENKDLPITRSGICYLPAGFFELVKDPLLTAQKENADATLDFVFKVEAVKAGNPAGYEWAYTPLMAQTTADPLAHLRGDAQKLISAPASQQAAPAQTEKPKAAAKK